MSDLESLVIDEEFERVIPPLDEKEFNQLKENILQDGEVYLPIMVWNNIIVDGHHRYKILQEHPEIPFRVIEKTFDNRYEAIIWICNNQFGRRNLSEFQISTLLGRRYKTEKQLRVFYGNRYTGSLVGETKFPQLKKPKTAERIANEMGVSHTTVKKAEKIVDGLDAAEEISPGITKEIMSGQITPTKQEVAFVAKAPADKRTELVDMLRKPRKTMTPEEKEHRKALFRSIEELDAMHTDTNKARVSADSMLVSLRADVNRATRTMDFYFREFPEILTETEYKSEVRDVLNIMKKYINELEEKMDGQNTV